MRSKLILNSSKIFIFTRNNVTSINLDSIEIFYCYYWTFLRSWILFLSRNSTCKMTFFDFVLIHRITILWHFGGHPWHPSTDASNLAAIIVQILAISPFENPDDVLTSTEIEPDLAILLSKMLHGPLTVRFSLQKLEIYYNEWMIKRQRQELIEKLSLTTTASCIR